MTHRASGSYRPALDGIRTLAVYLVVLFHSGLSAADGGFIGVDLFFVLSGFLITNVLLDDLDQQGTIRFGRFYARRARRLLPAALVVIAVTSLAAVVLVSIVQRLSYVGDAQSALLYVANWHFLNAENDYFAADVNASAFLHYWSLSIEEQFYCAFPLLLLGLVRAGRGGRAVPLAGLLALCAMSVAAQVWWSGSDPSHAYYGTDARVYQLLAGAALAYALRGGQFRLPARSGEAAGLAGAVSVLLLSSGLFDMAVSVRGLAATAAGLVLLTALTVRGDSRTAKLFSQRHVAYLGRISYGTYLWHWPVILVLSDIYGVGPLGSAVAGGLAATSLAALSYHLLEWPVRSSRTLGRIGWPTAAAGVAVCTVAAVAVVPPVLSSDRRPAVTAARATTTSGGMSDVPVPEPPPPERDIPRADRRRVPDLDWRALVDDTGPARTCDASTVEKCLVVRGSGPRVLLVGDSHGRMVAPMLIQLARERGFSLAMNVVPSCPWQADLATLWQPAAAQHACDQARDVWYRDALPALDPDVVILAEYPRDDPDVYGQTLRRVGGSDESLHQLLANTTDETLRRITSSGARALIMKSTIVSRFDPLDCLASSKFVDRCEVVKPRGSRFMDRVFDRADGRSRQTFTFTLNDDVCPAPHRCAAVVDGISVWRNVNHYSTRILRHVRTEIWSRIVATGAFAGL